MYNVHVLMYILYLYMYMTLYKRLIHECWCECVMQRGVRRSLSSVHVHIIIASEVSLPVGQLEHAVYNYIYIFIYNVTVYTTDPFGPRWPRAMRKRSQLDRESS